MWEKLEKCKQCGHFPYVLPSKELGKIILCFHGGEIPDGDHTGYTTAEEWNKAQGGPQ